jgi:hypothetical protein
MTDTQRIALDRIMYGIRKHVPEGWELDADWDRLGEEIGITLRARVMGRVGRETKQIPDGPFQRWKARRAWRMRLFGKVRYQTVCLEWHKTCPHIVAEPSRTHLAYLAEAPHMRWEVGRE